MSGGFCDGHVKLATEIAIMMQVIQSIKDEISAFEERVYEEIKELKYHDAQHYKTNTNIEKIIAGVMEILKSYKETLDKFERTLEKTIQENKNVSEGTEKIYQLLTSVSNLAIKQSEIKDDKSSEESLSKIISKNVDVFKSIIFILAALVFFLLGAKLDIIKGFFGIL